MGFISRDAFLALVLGALRVQGFSPRMSPLVTIPKELIRATNEGGGMIRWGLSSDVTSEERGDSEELDELRFEGVRRLYGKGEMKNSWLMIDWSAGCLAERHLR